MDNNNFNNPYRNLPPNSKPISFPEANREFDRAPPELHSTVTIPMVRYAPPSPGPRHEDIQSDSVPRRFPSPIHVRIPPIASPEDDINNGVHETKIVETQAPKVEKETHIPNLEVPANWTPGGPKQDMRYVLSLRTLIELLSIFVAMIPMIVAPHFGAYQRGFYCNDPDIGYPFKEGTVKPWLLYLFSLGLPAVVVIVGEMCRFYVSKTGYATMEVKYQLWKKGPYVKPVLISMTRVFVLFIYGFLITKSVTDISKYAVGRLRPHFLDVCKPDYNAITNKIGGDCAGRYVLEPFCTTVDDVDPKVQYRLRDSRLSFLSGHASIAFYSMFFLVFYLESRLRWMNLRYCKAIIQFGLFLMAALTGMSRISDHKHHWTDVFAGALLGIIVCIITVFFIGGFFNDRRFLRHKIVSMLNKLDWDNQEGHKFARLLSTSDGDNPAVLRNFKHLSRADFPKSA